VKEGIAGYRQTLHQVLSLQLAELTARKDDLEYLLKKLHQAEELQSWRGRGRNRTPRGCS